MAWVAWAVWVAWEEWEAWASRIRLALPDLYLEASRLPTKRHFLPRRLENSANNTKLLRMFSPIGTYNWVANGDRQFSSAF